MKRQHHPAQAPRYDVLFDPATLVVGSITVGQIATAASAAATAVSALGALQQGKAARQQSEFQSEVLQQRADRDEQIGKIEADRARRQGSRVSAQQRALLAGSGVTTSGTPLLVMSQTAAETELNALQILSGSDTAAIRKRQQAGLTRQQGRATQRASFFRAGSSLLRGGTSTFQTGRELEVF